MSENADKDDSSWRLFTSEDMINGYKALKRMKIARNVKKASGFMDREAGVLSVNSAYAANSSTVSSTTSSENIKSTSCKNKLRQKTPLRTPFTDITNKIPRTNDDRDKAKAKYKMRGNARLKYLGRNLLDDELSKNQTASAIVDDENCEMPRFEDCDHSLFEMGSSNGKDSFVS
ncbi:uncharacterized protein LOC135152818 [Daucus carota subsp. sativus]|uniref:uncharacterized protein LOC135152818 n=1 Tax=Daucus carota subsp. sativus TaxID=79200 RepID=UPI0030831E91